MSERAIVFRCEGADLLGILHEPSADASPLGVVFVVGGPQYRVGSHRQFVLMARAFAASGHPVLRFDYRGMGDSGGDYRGFEGADDDIRAAVDAICREVSPVRNVLIFGLCDGASAAMMYAPTDNRVVGLILANPWVHSESGEARAYIQHYYGRRFMQGTFWRKLLSGKLDFRASVGDLVAKARLTRAPRRGEEPGFVERMRRGLASFGAPVLILISERDLTASEFMDLCKSDDRWAKTIVASGIDVRSLAGADHTFSTGQSLRLAIESCLSWIASTRSRLHAGA